MAAKRFDVHKLGDLDGPPGLGGPGGQNIMQCQGIYWIDWVSIRLLCCPPLTSLARVIDDLRTPFSALHLPHLWARSLHGSCMHDFLCETSVLPDLTMCIIVAVVTEGPVALEERTSRVCNTSPSGLFCEKACATVFAWLSVQGRHSEAFTHSTQRVLPAA